jgi:hypothetical protein
MNFDKAKEIMFEHLPVEISLAHDAIGMYIAISEQSKALNKPRFAHAFGLIQRHALGAFILSLCKLFEPQNPRYPNFSIPTAICHLQDHLVALPSPNQNCIKLEVFIQNHIDHTFKMARQADLVRGPALILEYFADTYPQVPPRRGNDLDHVLDALKVLRDKRVAHPEDCNLEELSKTDLDGALRLLAYAKTFVNICGYGFFGFSMEAVATVDQLEPKKSKAWSQVSNIIRALQQTDPGNSQRTRRV